MPRYSIPPMAQGPGGTVPQRRDGIADLIYEQGRIRADAAARSGDMWANTIAGIGQNIGGVIAEREGQKQLRKRDAAWVSFVESGEWQKDPQAAYGVARRIWGPDADKQMQGLESVQKLSAAMQGKPLDPAEAKKSLGSIVRAIKPMGNEAWERWWPTLSKLAQTALPGAELPPNFDPAQRAEYEAIGESLLGDKPAGTREVKIRNADGTETTKIVPDVAGQEFVNVPAPKRQVVTVPGPDGRPMAKMVDDTALEAGVPTYVPPKGPGEKFWVMRDGKPLRISDSEYRPGDKPASTREQGRPVTSGDSTTIAELDSSLDDLNTLAVTLSGNKATGTKAKLGASLWNPITELTGWGADAKAKQATIDGVKQVIGKALEGGVLRKEDEYKYEKILPTIGDVPSVVKAKLEGLWSRIQQKRTTFLESKADAGYDVEKYAARAPRMPAQPGTGDGIITTPDGKKWKQIDGQYVEQ